MTHTELIQMVADGVGASYEEAHGFIQTFIDIVISQLDAGDEVKIRGLGTFKWAEVAPKEVPVYHGHGLGWRLIPAGKKLRFIPATKLKTRRPIMADEDEGMDKYAVVTEDPDGKTAADGADKICPVCGKTLDNGGACPTHGTEPFEPND